MTKIVVLGRFQGAADELPRVLTDDEVIVPTDDSALAAVAADAEVGVGTNQGGRVQALFAVAPKLRWYHSLGAGVEDLVGIAELRERKIVLTNNSGPYDIPIAEHVLATILASAKRLHLYRDQQARAEWRSHPQDEVRDRTVVVFGIGSIGAEVAKLASGVGMNVIGVRRREGSVAGVSRVVPPERLAEVAAEADYLVLAAPLTNETQGAVSRRVIARMKPTAWIVNIARGAMLDEDALVDALRAGRLGGAALDALTVEPLPKDHPLWTLPNVIITPHSSNSSPRIRERSVALFRENLRRYKVRESLLNVVDPDAGY